MYFSIKTNICRFVVVLAFFLCLEVVVYAARIGIYPGSFDPIHIGHLEVARSALVKLQLDAVYLMPNGTNPRKPNMSAIELRAELIEAALNDYDDERLRLFPIAEIEASAAAGSVEDAPVRLLDLARQTFAKDCIYQILGTDSVFKVVESSGVTRINDSWRLAVCNRPGYEFKLNRVCRRLQRRGWLEVFDSFSDLEISSSAIRKACAGGDYKFLASVLSPSTFAALVKQGGHGQILQKAWLEALLALPGDVLPTDRYPNSEPVLLAQKYLKDGENADFVVNTVEPRAEIAAIDFSLPHSLGELRTYVESKLTPLGLKVIANPHVETLIFPGNQRQLAHWLAQQGISSGKRITRNRSYITMGVHLVKTPAGRTLAIVDEVYGLDRMRHTQALVAAGLHLSGRNSADFRVVESADFPEDAIQVYSKELKPVVPGTIDAAIIGFHWKVVNDLERRHALFKMCGSHYAITDGRLAQKWREWHSRLNPDCERHSWPRRHFANQDVPFSFLAFKDKKQQPVNVLLTRNVYGDQLASLLKVLIEEKKIKKIILFGNAGGLTEASAIGDIILPIEVRRFDTDWVRVTNSLLTSFSGDFAAGRVYSVFSPLVETSAFIQDLKNQGALAVDVENGYLVDFAGVENLSVGSIVVISDVPGSEATLAHLEENEKKMETSLVKSLDMILKDLELTRPGDHRFPIND